MYWTNEEIESINKYLDEKMSLEDIRSIVICLAENVFNADKNATIEFLNLYKEKKQNLGLSAKDQILKKR